MKKLMTFSVALTCAVAIQAGILEDCTVPCVETNAAGKVFRYRWHEPTNVVAGAKCPLVVFFHGAGERGTDNFSQMRHCIADILLRSEKKEPCFILAGQVPNGQLWVDTPWGNLEHRMPKEPTSAMALALDKIDALRMDPRIDPDRIYACGISMGGYGTWDAIMRHPDWFAAAMPVCGGADITKAYLVRDLPIWVFHGGADTIVPTWRSRSMVSALWVVNGKVRYREYPGVGHNSWSATFNDPVTLDWMFAQRRGRDTSK